MATRLLSIVEFAAALAPFVEPVSAVNQLADWRRREKFYRKRTTHRPVWVKIKNVVRYPESELAKTIAGIKAYRAKHPKT